MSVDLLILTLNEVDGIRKIMPQIDQKCVDNIVIVDGGSTDGTIEEAKKQGFEVIKQKRKGHGDGVRIGVEATSSDYIVIFGPDGNHDPNEIPKLIEKAKEGYDQVIVSRFGKTSVNLDAGIVDRFGNRMFTFLVNVFFGGHFTDCLNESRIITRNAMNQLDFDAMYLDSTQQMSIQGLKKRQKIYEIIGNEGERIGGKRKMKPLKVGSQLTVQIIKEFIFW
ncbi:MAG: glycosyltransferase family 2 protein [Nitrosopumilaceae archaeon]